MNAPIFYDSIKTHMEIRIHTGSPFPSSSKDVERWAELVYQLIGIRVNTFSYREHDNQWEEFMGILLVVSPENEPIEFLKGQMSVLVNMLLNPVKVAGIMDEGTIREFYSNYPATVYMLESDPEMNDGDHAVINTDEGEELYVWRGVGTNHSWHQANYLHDLIDDSIAVMRQKNPKA